MHSGAASTDADTFQRGLTLVYSAHETLFKLCHCEALSVMKNASLLLKVAASGPAPPPVRAGAIPRPGQRHPSSGSVPSLSGPAPPLVRARAIPVRASATPCPGVCHPCPGQRHPLSGPVPSLAKQVLLLESHVRTDLQDSARNEILLLWHLRHALAPYCHYRYPYCHYRYPYCHYRYPY